MTINDIETKIRKMQEWEQLAADAKAEADALRDEIKAVMLEQGTEEMKAGEYKIRYSVITSSRFDSKAFKATYAALYQQFVKPTTSRRFSVA